MLNKIKKILVEETQDEVIKRLRITLNRMKSIDGWQVFIDNIKKDKSPNHSPGLQQKLDGILKLFGVGDFRMSGFERTYWFATTFLDNGGYDRDFIEGPPPVLAKIPTYEVEMSYTEEVFEHRTGWGTVVGVNTEEEALEVLGDTPESWIEDSEHEDSDYGEIVEVSDIEIKEAPFIVFKKEWVGL
tara:strand:- start:1591 stop:2148 length:558 start_codon:yes stop_codon:yes gene_type:complete